MSGVAQYAAMLHPGDAETPPMSRSPSPYSSTLPKDASTSKAKTKKKMKSKGKKKASNWANKCMYAELLEMREDPIWPDGFNERFHDIQDGLPDDLETSWVGLAPIPIGKRCLAVTMQSGGESGIGNLSPTEFKHATFLINYYWAISSKYNASLEITWEGYFASVSITAASEYNSGLYSR